MPSHDVLKDFDKARAAEKSARKRLAPLGLTNQIASSILVMVALLDRIEKLEAKPK